MPLQVKLKSPEGGTLKTANTYIEDDINIVPNLQNKTITKNGSYTADEGYAGLGNINIQVAGEGGVDTSQDTVTEDAMLEGFTAHNAFGEAITGNIGVYDGTISGGLAVSNVEPTFTITGAGSWEVKNVTKTDSGYNVESLGIQDFNLLSYHFEEGMTWDDFLHSEYNVVVGGQDATSAESDIINEYSGQRLRYVEGVFLSLSAISMEKANAMDDIFEPTYVLTCDSVIVQLTDTIKNGTTYSLVDASEYYE